MLQMLTQQKTACDAMLDEKNKLITEYQAVCIVGFVLPVFMYTARIMKIQVYAVHICTFICSFRS